MAFALPSNELVADHLRFARAFWDGGTDLPDPLRYRDVLSSVEATGRVIRCRLAADRPHGQPRRLDFPKPNGTENRTMTVLDPFSQIIFRILVGRVVKAADASLCPEVLHARVGFRHTAWFTKPWRSAQRQKRDFIEASRESGEFRGFGIVDIRSHYETVRVEALRPLLYSCGCLPNSVEALIRLVAELQAVPGVAAGLPIGPESSAPLGTLALRPVDRQLVANAAVFVRYMDDYLVLADSAAAFEDHVEVVDAQARVADQAVNRAKLSYTDFGEPDAGLDAASTEGEAWSQIGEDPLFEFEAAIAAGNEKDIPKLLGRLREDGDARAARLIERDRWVLHQFPRQVAQYMDRIPAKRLDWRWVRDEILASVSDGRPAVALHLAAVLPGPEIPPSFGGELWEAGTSMDVQTMSPVRAMFFAAAGRGQEKPKTRVRRALDAADGLGDLNERRALVGSIRSTGGLNGNARAGVAHLGRVDADLAPTASWVLAACP